MLYIVGKLTCSQCYALFDTYRFDLVTVFVIFAIEISDFGETWGSISTIIQKDILAFAG